MVFLSMIYLKGCKLNEMMHLRFYKKKLFPVYVSYKHTQATLSTYANTHSGVFLHVDLCTALVAGLRSLLT